MLGSAAVWEASSASRFAVAYGLGFCDTAVVAARTPIDPANASTEATARALTNFSSRAVRVAHHAFRQAAWTLDGRDYGAGVPEDAAPRRGALRPDLDKPRGVEVAVERQGLTDAANTHECKARGIHKRVRAFVVPAQPPPCIGLHGGIDRHHFE